MLGYGRLRGHRSTTPRTRPQGRPIGRRRQGRRAAAGADHRARRRQAHAAGAEELLRRRAGAGALLRAPGRRAAHRRRRREAARRHLLLEVLTPIAKSWPSEWCLEANSLAIQVLGGYGYTRDFPVEQYWRDNRLNMIHEGTHGIQALDLLGRKVVMGERRRPQRCCARRIDATIERRPRRRSRSRAHAEALAGARRAARRRDRARPGRPARPRRRSPTPRRTCRPSATSSSPGSGSTSRSCAAGVRPTTRLQRGRLAACRYFFHYELPKIGAWLGVVERRDDTCRTMAED